MMLFFLLTWSKRIFSDLFDRFYHFYDWFNNHVICLVCEHQSSNQQNERNQDSSSNTESSFSSNIALNRNIHSSINSIWILNCKFSWSILWMIKSFFQKVKIMKSKSHYWITVLIDKFLTSKLKCFRRLI